MKINEFAKKYKTDGLLVNDRGNGSAGAKFLNLDDDTLLALNKSRENEVEEVSITDDHEAWELIRESAKLFDCPAPIAVAVFPKKNGYQMIVGC